jgi:hypothetical protein
VRLTSKEGLTELSDLLSTLALMEGLQEKKADVYCRKSKAFLHFHEDGDLLFADVKLDGLNFERHPCSTRQEKRNLVSLISETLSILRRSL